MEYGKSTQKNGNETGISPLQFDEEIMDESLEEVGLNNTRSVEGSVNVPVADTKKISLASTPKPISQSLTRGCVHNSYGRTNYSLPGSASISAPISIPASSRVITGFTGPTSSPSTAASQPPSLPSSRSRSTDSNVDLPKSSEMAASPPSHTGMGVSPIKGIFGSLLSQRLSGMTQEQREGPEVQSQLHSPLQKSISSHGSEQSPQRSPGTLQIPNFVDSSGSLKSYASSFSQGSDLSPTVQLSGSGCSTDTSNRPPSHLKIKNPKCRAPLKVELPKRHHTFSESAGYEQSPASLRSLFGSITVWKSGSILSRHLSQGSSSRIVNYVTEAQSVLPSLTSAFSIDHLEEKELGRQIELAMYDLQDSQHAVSHQDKLDILDILEDNEYIDTVKSTDSAASLLRRSMSVPPQYHYKPQKLVLQDIFSQAQTEQNGLNPATGKPVKKPTPAHVVENEARWRQTMDDLLEQPEYVDTLESICSRTGLLASQAQAIAQQYGTKLITEPISKSPLPPKSGEQNVSVKQLRFIYFKNLIVLSISFMFVFMAYMSLRNLQSSLYKKGGLGLLALSSIYASLFIGCIFTTTIVQHLRPKRTIVLCMFSLLLYVAANFYPSYYTLIPACTITGFCLSNLWTAHATYLANIAARYAILIDDKVQNVLSQFNGIFFGFFQMSQIIGGLISSLVLSPSSLNNNVSNTTEMENTSTAYLPQCGSQFCSYLADSSEASDANSTVDRSMFYILISTYAGCVMIGLVIIMSCLDPLDGVMKKSQTSLSKQLTAVFRFFLQWKVVCLLGLMFYTMLQSSFMFGEFTKAFVTCTSGVYLVGYTMVCLSGMSALSSFISGRLQRYVGRKVLYATGLFGVLFADNKEPAFAGLKMTQAFGVTVLFAVSEYLCTYVKLILLLIFAILGILGLAVLEFRLKKENDDKKAEPTDV
ncbi:hypothetical protein LSH36_108g01118 [Paralvinella palmiformis]|uniref:Uncharacterized protein n=1 Tax=Paralvinella palmiformis TaxID=53620 RepID=A0AAD9NC69_9ANNE|nr:hypothetical protein LSH36_108g01118 [Paralvinella palmiformis]